MPNESLTRRIIRDKLGPYGRVHRIENRIDRGTPDAVYGFALPRREPVTGWLELKYLDRYPARGGPIRIKTLTLEQVDFLKDWPGHAYLLLQVGHDFALLSHYVARSILDGICYEEDVRTRALVYGEGEFPTADMLRCLTRSLR